MSEENLSPPNLMTEQTKIDRKDLLEIKIARNEANYYSNQNEDTNTISHQHKLNFKYKYDNKERYSNATNRNVSNNSNIKPANISSSNVKSTSNVNNPEQFIDISKLHKPAYSKKEPKSIQNTSSAENLLDRTKKIFQNNIYKKDFKQINNISTIDDLKGDLSSNKPYISNVSTSISTINPSTVIINNNININTFVSKNYTVEHRDYQPLRSSYKDSTRNYLQASDMKEQTGTTYKTKDLTRNISLDKENIRKKIDDQISTRNKYIHNDNKDSYNVNDKYSFCRDKVSTASSTGLYGNYSNYVKTSLDYNGKSRPYQNKAIIDSQKYHVDNYAPLTKSRYNLYNIYS